MPLSLVTGLALIFLAIVLVGTYTFLPPLAERMVARNVQEGLGLGERPQVELQSDPLPAMLAGKFSGGRVSLGDADLGVARADRVVVDLDPFDLDVAGSVTGGALRSESPLSGTLRAEVSEQEISQLAKAGVQDIELEEDRVLVRSEARVLGFDVPVSVQGSLILRDGALAFEPQRASALGTPVPEQLLAGADFSYPLGRLPYGAKITGVEVGWDRLVLSGEMKRIPLNRPIG
jgi:hypothetical protein